MAAQAPDTPLEFLGFRAGGSLAQLDARFRELGGDGLRCDKAKADRRVHECRAVVSDPSLGTPVNLLVSAIDSTAGVVLLSSTVGADQLDRWRTRLETKYGSVGARAQGTQWMMQWVRRGRMLRLTWRIEGGKRIASVSLVDGRTLDGWGRSRRTPSP